MNGTGMLHRPDSQRHLHGGDGQLVQLPAHQESFMIQASWNPQFTGGSQPAVAQALASCVLSNSEQPANNIKIDITLRSRSLFFFIRGLREFRIWKPSPKPHCTCRLIGRSLRSSFNFSETSSKVTFTHSLRISEPSRKWVTRLRG